MEARRQLEEAKGVVVEGLKVVSCAFAQVADSVAAVDTDRVVDVLQDTTSKLDKQVESALCEIDKAVEALKGLTVGKEKEKEQEQKEKSSEG